LIGGRPSHASDVQKLAAGTFGRRIQKTRL
jgi:hypothetical protein